MQESLTVGTIPIGSPLWAGAPGACEGRPSCCFKRTHSREMFTTAHHVQKGPYRAEDALVPLFRKGILNGMMNCALFATVPYQAGPLLYRQI